MNVDFSMKISSQTYYGGYMNICYVTNYVQCHSVKVSRH